MAIEVDISVSTPIAVEVELGTPLQTTIAIAGAQGAGGENTKSLSLIAPNSSEDIAIFYTEREITISRLVFNVSSGAITWNLRASATRSGAGTDVLSADETTTAETEVFSSGFASPVIAANRFLRFLVTGKTGSVADLHLTLNYHL